MRKLIFGIIIVVALIVVFMRGDSFFQLIETMKTGSLVPLIIAIVCQLSKYVAQSVAFSNSFKTVGERLSPKDTINLVFGMFFMNTIAPSVGASGIMLVADDAKQRGMTAGKGASAAVLMQVSIDTGFLIIMVIGFFVLGFTGNFNPWLLLFALIDIALVGIMAMLLILGHSKPEVLMKIFGGIENLVNKVMAKFKRDPAAPWAADLIAQFGEAAVEIKSNPNKAVKVFIFSVVASFCELGCFALCSFAFGITSLPAIVVGYVAATMFAMVSITPQGVGFAEAAIVLFMCAYSVEAAAATAAGIVYRGLVFWLPFAIGAVLINRTKSFGHSDRKSKRKKKVAEQQLPVFDENGQLINQLVEPCVQSDTNDSEVASK